MSHHEALRPQPFEDLTHRASPVLKEHFDEFRSSDRRYTVYAKKIPTRVFNLCVDQTQKAPYPELVILQRAKLAVPPYHKLHPSMPTTFKGAYLAEFGIEAGSLVDLLPSLQAIRSPRPQEEYLAALVTQLSSQIESAN